MAGSLFGGPAASSGGLFGASSSSLFATPGGSAGTLFGQSASTASTGGLFGTADPATPASASGSLFGAPASSAAGGGLFGAAAAPAASSGGLFGGTPASSAGGLFGAAPASSAGGLFGASGSGLGPSLASSGGLFGTPAASSASLFGASGGGLFGAQSSAAGGGLFGAQSSAAGGGLFGASGGGLFGASTGQLALGGQAAAAQPAAAPNPAKLQQIAQEQATLFSALKDLDTAATPGAGKLTRLFLYTLDKSQHARPPNVPEAAWQYALQRAGGAANAEGRWPVAVHGLGQLKAHRDAQAAAASASRDYLSELRAAVHGLQAAERHELRARAQAIVHRHSELAHRLLKVARLVDALEARVVTSAPPAALHAKLAELDEKLRLLEAQLADSNARGLTHSVNALSAAVDLAAAGAGGGGGGASATAAGLDDATLADAAELLREHNKGIASLQAHLRRIDRDVTIAAAGAGAPRRASLPER